MRLLARMTNFGDMRGTTWIAAILMFGCAQSAGHEEPAVLASAGAASDGGPATATGDPAADAGAGAAADGGVPLPAAAVDRYCDPAVDAAAGVTITDTGRCPGILLAAPSCAADVQLCPGGSPPGGTFASAARSDAQGAIAVACTSYDSGATMYRLGLASARYAAATQLGEEVVPLQSGFAAVPRSRPAPVRFFAHDGAQLASVALNGPFAIVTPAGLEILSADAAAGGWDITAQLFGDDGAAKGARQHLAHATTNLGIGLAGAADMSGQVLVTWSTYDQFATFARWLGPDGAPLTEAFEISAWAGHAAGSAALPGGGVAVGDTSGARWRGVLAPGSMIASPVPAWLAARGEFTLVRGGAGALFGGSELVAADGTSCGTIAFADHASAKAGTDGTLFHPSPDGKSFRIYPQLLR